jgi:uncharacterized membrane protein HdeD (DUF308 family)
MESEMSNLTGSLVLRGVLSILFGIAAVFWPGLTVVTLLYLFAAFLLVGGLVELVMSAVHLGTPGTSVLTKIMKLVLGILQIGVGVYLLRHPHITFVTFILLIGFSLIVRGVFEIMEGLFDEGPSMYRVVMVIVGLFAALAGIIVLFQPRAASVAFVWVIGLYALISGPLLIAAALDAKKLAAITPAKR